VQLENKQLIRRGKRCLVLALALKRGFAAGGASKISDLPIIANRVLWCQNKGGEL
jgi:hypothetical protein